MTTPLLQWTNSTASPATRGTRVLHSHHYLAALLRPLVEADDIDATSILRQAVGACEEAVDRQAAGATDGVADGAAQALFREWGIGTLELALVPRGDEGLVRLRASHSAMAWRRRFPPSARPVCGIAAALLERILSDDAERQVAVEETSCAAAGGEYCEFRVVPAGERPRSALGGSLSTEGRRLSGGAASKPYGAGDGLADLSAADSDCLPGAPFVALPAEFYAALCHLFEREVPRVRGAKFGNLPGILLLEAAHRNGFHLFWETLASAGWTGAAENVRMESDRIEALLSVPETLGWGSWQVHDFVPGERLIVRIDGSYEALAHARLFGRSAGARCTVARGAAAAAMNLLYRAGAALGSDGSPPSYNALFRSPDSFRAVETRCRAHGDPVCELVVNPLTF